MPLQIVLWLYLSNKQNKSISFPYAAVGSSSLIAEEIHDIMRTLLGARIPIITCRTEEITDASAADLYLCARTQYEHLSHIIPSDRLFLMDLQADSTFFLRIARIPRGNDVYIFNNYTAYPNALAEYCRSLGIDGVHYIPLAFEEKSPEALQAALSNAHYIIGVDRFIALLQKPPYCDMLPHGAAIIAGRRTASPNSVFAVLRRLGTLLLVPLRALMRETDALSIGQLRSVAAEIDCAIDILQAGTIHTVVSQADAAAPVPQAPSLFYTDMAEKNLRDYIAERFSLLEALHTKISILNR